MGIDWRSTYHDLCLEIEILELRAKDLEYQMKVARRTIFSGRMPSSGHMVILPLDKALEKFDDAKDRLLELVDILEHKKRTLKEIEGKLEGFQGLEYKVAYLRDIERLPLDRIADQLGYSYNWVAKVSSRVKRVREGKNKAKIS